MFFRIISYIKFLFSSTNQHGVHSPFVYSFVTKGLYKKNIVIINFGQNSQLKNLSKKQQKTLSKIEDYFKVDKIYFDYLTFTKNSNKKYKTLYTKEIKKIQSFNFNTLSSTDFILIDGIYKNKESYLNWQEIIQNKEITVTIDLFYFGLIFVRKEQAKEHFKIRI